jgi:hypothetical protein
VWSAPLLLQLVVMLLALVVATARMFVAVRIRKARASLSA